MPLRFNQIDTILSHTMSVEDDKWSIGVSSLNQRQKQFWSFSEREARIQYSETEESEPIFAAFLSDSEQYCFNR